MFRFLQIWHYIQPPPSAKLSSPWICHLCHRCALVHLRMWRTFGLHMATIAARTRLNVTNEKHEWVVRCSVCRSFNELNIFMFMYSPGIFHHCFHEWMSRNNRHGPKNTGINGLNCQAHIRVYESHILFETMCVPVCLLTNNVHTNNGCLCALA